VAAIRKALLELLADPARARALGQAARQRAAGFTWERFARELIALSGGG